MSGFDLLASVSSLAQMIIQLFDSLPTKFAKVTEETLQGEKKYIADLDTGYQITRVIQIRTVWCPLVQ